MDSIKSRSWSVVVGGRPCRRHLAFASRVTNERTKQMTSKSSVEGTRLRTRRVSKELSGVRFRTCLSFHFPVAKGFRSRRLPTNKERYCHSHFSMACVSSSSSRVGRKTLSKDNERSSGRYVSYTYSILWRRMRAYSNVFYFNEGVCSRFQLTATNEWNNPGVQWVKVQIYSQRMPKSTFCHPTYLFWHTIGTRTSPRLRKSRSEIQEWPATLK